MKDKRKIFFVLTVSQVFSGLADRALIVGLSWYLISQYSNSVLSLYLTLSMLPHLFMTFFSAKLINKYSPISIMRFSELIRSIMIGGLVCAVYYGNSKFGYVYIITFTMIANIFAAIFNPALLTIPRQLDLEDKDLQKITGLLNSSSSVSRMLGPIIALPLYTYLGISGLVVGCFGFYFLAWIFELYLKNVAWINDIENTEKTPRLSYLLQLMKDNHVVIKLLIIFFLMNLVVIPIQLFMPLVAKHTFHQGFHALTLFELALGFGLLSGGVLISVYPLLIKLRYRIWLPYFLASIFYILFALVTKSYLYSIANLFCFGVFLAVGNVICISLYQQITKKHYVAQIMVLVNLISNASGPVSMAIAGLLIALLPINKLILSYAIFLLLVGFLLFFIRELNKD